VQIVGEQRQWSRRHDLVDRGECSGDRVADRSRRDAGEQRSQEGEPPPLVAVVGGRAAADEPQFVRPMLRGGEKRRLADARLADDVDRRAATVTELDEGVLDERDLGRPPDEWGCHGRDCRFRHPRP
jgi:hypothetical protein